jgi:phosphotriesterase-related protein
VSERPTVMTVNGPVPADELGTTMMHEHLLDDITVWFAAADDAGPDLERPVEMSMLGRLRRDAFSITRDNLRLSDPLLAAEEARRFASAGGRTIVDVTPPALGRNPEGLRQIARDSGLNIVMGCGYYVEPAHPASLAAMSADEIADELEAEITDGVDGTGIRPGIIGEIGTSGADRETGRKHGHVTAAEEKVLRGAARAAVRTGLSLSIHLDPRGQGGDQVLDILASEALPAQRTILGHLDHVPELDYHLRLAERGVYLQYDNFGREYYWDAEGVYWNNDKWRVDALAALLRDGRAAQLLVSQDVCFKMDLRAYGGYGYDHVLVDIVPALRRAGVTETDLTTILVDNPRAVLATAAPATR